MATWGQLKIQYNKYDPDQTLYYSYQTSTDTYLFISTYRDDDFCRANEDEL